MGCSRVQSARASLDEPSQSPASLGVCEKKWLDGTGRSLAVLALGWLVAAALVNPVAEVPLNDDWAYSHVVRTLIDEGRLEFTDWQSMPLLTQVLWGALFCLPCGFSFTALRISTLVAAYLGAVALLGLLCELGATRRQAFFAAACLLCSPLYFSLSFTFMTDVPFVAACLGAVWLWVGGIKRGSTTWAVAAVGLSICATLNRQLGLALPLAFAVGELVRLGVTRRALARAALPVACTAAALLLYQLWLANGPGTPGLYHQKEDALRVAISGLLSLRGWRLPLERTLSGLLLLGGMLLPLFWLLPLPGLQKKSARRVAIAAAVAMALAAALLGLPESTSGDIMDGAGLGVRTSLGNDWQRPDWLGIAALVATCLPASVVAALVARALLDVALKLWRADRSVPVAVRKMLNWLPSLALEPWCAAILVALLALLHGPTAIAHAAYFDRYIVVLIPWVLVLWWAASASGRGLAVKPWTGVVLLALLLIADVAATHDYLAWQRARWEAVEYLSERGARPAQIRAGFEVDQYGPWGEPRTSSADHVSPFYLVAISPTPGHQTVHAVPVNRWLPFTASQVLVLRPEQ